MHQPSTIFMESMKTHVDAVKVIRRLCCEVKTTPESWENLTLDRYLDAMAAWLEASEKKGDVAPSWDLFIQMLEAAKIYE